MRLFKSSGRPPVDDIACPLTSSAWDRPPLEKPAPFSTSGDTKLLPYACDTFPVKREQELQDRVTLCLDTLAGNDLQRADSYSNVKKSPDPRGPPGGDAEGTSLSQNARATLLEQVESERTIDVMV